MPSRILLFLIFLFPWVGQAGAYESFPVGPAGKAQMKILASLGEDGIPGTVFAPHSSQARDPEERLMLAKKGKHKKKKKHKHKSREGHEEKHGYEGEGAHEHGHGHGKARLEWPHGCELPPGLAKKNKVPPGWAKKCGRKSHVHHEGHEVEDHHSHKGHVRKAKHHGDDGGRGPCNGPLEVIAGSDHSKLGKVATGGAVGAGMGGVIGSATGETEEGAVLGAAVGGLIGAASGDDDPSGFAGKHKSAGSGKNCD